MPATSLADPAPLDPAPELLVVLGAHEHDDEARPLAVDLVEQHVQVGADELGLIEPVVEAGVRAEHVVQFLGHPVHIVPLLAGERERHLESMVLDVDTSPGPARPTGQCDPLAGQVHVLHRPMGPVQLEAPNVEQAAHRLEILRGRERFARQDRVLDAHVAPPSPLDRPQQAELRVLRALGLVGEHTRQGAELADLFGVQRIEAGGDLRIGVLGHAAGPGQHERLAVPVVLVARHQQVVHGAPRSPLSPLPAARLHHRADAVGPSPRFRGRSLRAGLSYCVPSLGRPSLGPPGFHPYRGRGRRLRGAGRPRNRSLTRVPRKPTGVIPFRRFALSRSARADSPAMAQVDRRTSRLGRRADRRQDRAFPRRRTRVRPRSGARPATRPGLQMRPAFVPHRRGSRVAQQPVPPRSPAGRCPLPRWFTRSPGSFPR